MSTTLVVTPTDSKPLRIKKATLDRLVLADNMLRGGKQPKQVAEALGLSGPQGLYNLLYANGYHLGRVSFVAPRLGVADLATLAAQLEE